jgi:hypothetical protein
MSGSFTVQLKQLAEDIAHVAQSRIEHLKKEIEEAEQLKAKAQAELDMADSAASQVACPFRKSYPDVLVVQSTQDRNGDNGARSLDCSMQGRIFL